MVSNEDERPYSPIIVEDDTLRQGFTQIPNALLRLPDVSPGAKLTYMVLLSYAWQQGSCFPGQDTLAADMGAGRRSVVRYLQELQDAELLHIRRRGLGRTNIYVLPRFPQRPVAHNTGAARSAKMAHPEVPNATHLEVPNRHKEKDRRIEKDSEEKDSASVSKDRHIQRVVDNSTDTARKRVGPSNGLAILNTASEEQTAGQPGRIDERGRQPTALSDLRPQHVEVKTRDRQAGSRRVPSAAEGPGTPALDETPPESAPSGSEGPSTRSARVRPTPYIETVMTELSEQLHDGEHARANVTRAMRLFQASGLEEHAFVSLLYDARTITRQQGSVRKRATEPGLINRMPYFFAVLEDVLGLKEPPGRGALP
jgi:hypothetical protein